MVTLGLIAKQIVNKEVPGDSVELAVEVERALPAPYVKMRVWPAGSNAWPALAPEPAAQPTARLPCNEPSALAEEPEGSSI